MLKEFLTSFTGSATSAAFTNPAGYGINNVAPRATFGNFFNTLVNSMNNTNIFSGAPQGAFPPVGYNALQAYRNAQGQFLPQGNLKVQALAPGAVVVNSFPNTVQPPMPQAFNQGFIPPNQRLANWPVQGFANQTGAIYGSQGNYGLPYGQGAQFPYSSNGYPQANFSKLQLLLAPIVGLFTLIRSLFGLRRVVNSAKPVQIDRQDLNYYDYQNSFNNFERQEGSFDEYNPELEFDSFDTSKLESY